MSIIMGFGGSVSAMISSLKYNNSQLKRKRMYTVMKGYIEEERNKRIYAGKGDINKNSLSQNELNQIKTDIRTKIKREQRKLLIWQLLTSVMVVGGIAYFIFVVL